MRYGYPALVAAMVIGVAGCSPADDAEPEDRATSEPGVTTGDVEVTEEAPDDGQDAAQTGEPGEGQAGAGTPSSAGAAAPEDEIGQPVAIDPILVEGEDAVVAVTGITAYSTGMQVEVAVRTDPDEAEGTTQPDDPMGEMGRPSPQQDDLPEELLRIQVEYPDGEVASSADPPESEGEPTGPVLDFSSSQSTVSAWDYEFWLQPLPEPDDEDLQVVFEWPAQGIDASEPLDAAQIDAAAQRVTTLWQD